MSAFSLSTADSQHAARLKWIRRGECESSDFTDFDLVRRVGQFIREPSRLSKS